MLDAIIRLQAAIVRRGALALCVAFVAVVSGRFGLAMSIMTIGRALLTRQAPKRLCLPCFRMAALGRCVAGLPGRITQGTGIRAGTSAVRLVVSSCRLALRPITGDVIAVAQGVL